MKKLFKKIILTKAILKYLWDPRNVQSVLKLGNAVTTAKSRNLSVKKAKENPKIRQLIDRRFGLGDFNFSVLKEAPAKTLGFEFYNYLLREKLDPEFYKFKAPSKSDPEYAYIAFRLRKTHDLWHVVTGFDTSEEGEAGLIAFYYAQLGSPLSGLIIVLSFVHFFIRKPRQLPALLNEISKGWTMGKKAKPLLEISWENHWHTPYMTCKNNGTFWDKSKCFSKSDSFHECFLPHDQRLLSKPKVR